MLEIPILLAMLAAVPDPSPGISEELAAERSRRIANIHYDLDLIVPEQKSSPIEGLAKIRFDLKGTSDPIILDFAPGKDFIHSIQSKAQPVEWRWVNQHLILPAGLNQVEIQFRLGDGPLNRNADYFYSLFVPARAHHAIPCFDQPDLKVRFSVRMKLPAGWLGVANVEPGQETQPLPTYLLSFAAGKFQMETAVRDGRTLRLFHREPDAAKVARNRDAIFDLHATAIRWMENYTGIPYPFGKFDFFAVPAFQFGGMEHAGDIHYNANSLFLDETATQAQRLGRASLISHETAHMWFGDLVTMKWFNDVWLKEVFANFMAAKIVNPSFPELNHELRFFLSHYRTAYSVDRTAGSNAIRQKLANLNEAGTLYGPIIYQKSPIVMRQLEQMLGEINFRDGLRDYLKRYSYANATWSDLIAILDARTPMDLAAWSKEWVDRPGRPRIAVDLEVKNGKIARLALRQQTAHQQKLTIAIDERDYDNPQQSIGLAAPRFVLPRGYGDFVLDTASQKYLLAHLPELKDPLLRAEAWSTLWESMLSGRIEEAQMLDLVLLAIPQEPEELNLQRLLNDLERLAWRVRTRQADVEKLLRTGISKAPNRSVRSAYFQAFRSTAMSPEAVAWLKRIWSKEESVLDLPLAEADFVRLAAELSLRGIDVRQEQLARIQNTDRKAQFAFVMPALDADPAVRDRFFARLKERENRAKESWVLEALGYLHHPLRLSQSERYVLPSLGMLTEIQRTGDIFFPQRWASVTLANHRSPELRKEVLNWLKQLPTDYPERLKLNVLAAADELLRSTK